MGSVSDDPISWGYNGGELTKRVPLTRRELAVVRSAALRAGGFWGIGVRLRWESGRYTLVIGRLAR